MPVKVVIYGKSEAGKSTLVRRLIPGAVNISHDGRTTAMDYGTVKFENVDFHLFGTPGQPHFKPVREVISKGMHAAVFVVDSTRCLDAEDRDILMELDFVKVPYIIFLNQKPEKVAEMATLERSLHGFKLPFSIVAGSAKTGEGTEELLIALKGSLGKGLS